MGESMGRHAGTPAVRGTHGFHRVTAALLLLVAAARADTIKVAPGESVQAALDAAGPGDVIVLQAGVHAGGFTIGAGLDGLTLKGQGDAIVDAVGVENGIAVASPDVTVAKLAVRHAGNEGVWADGVSGVSLDQLLILRCGGPGILVSGNGALLTRCTVWACNGGIEVEGDDGVVERSDVLQDAADGIHVTGPRGRVERCRVAVSDVGRAIWVDGEQGVVCRNRVEDCPGRAILVEGDDALVEHNTVSGGLGTGVHVAGARPQLLRNTVSDVAAGEEGIFVDSTEGAVLERNQVRDCLGVGIACHTDGARIERNTVCDCGLRDPGLLVEGSDNELLDNSVKDCLSTGIEVSGVSNTVSGNRLQGHSDNGLLVSGGGSTNHTTVSGNLIKGNQGEGLENRGLDTTFSDNRFSQNRTDVANDGDGGSTLTDGGGNHFEGEIGQPEIGS